MSLSVCSRSSARATLGSYSISACSCVKLTATLSTPGRLLSAFSIVPVHNEQCSPPIRARIRRRPGSLEGSSLQKRGADSTVVAVLIMHLRINARPCSKLFPADLGHVGLGQDAAVNKVAEHAVNAGVGHE